MDKLYEWLSYRLPKRLVYFCAIRLMAEGTGSKYPTTNPGTVRAMTLLKRWEKNEE